MEGYCLDCFNKMNGTNHTETQVWLEENFCEGRAERKPCVVEIRPKPLLLRLVGWLPRLFQRQ